MKYAEFGFRTVINRLTVAKSLAEGNQDSPANTAYPVS